MSCHVTRMMNSISGSWKCRVPEVIVHIQDISKQRLG